MRAKILEAINLEYEMYPEAFGGPTSVNDILQAENELNVILPEDFKQFIRTYGSGAVGEIIVLGLKEAELVSTPSFVTESLRFRNELPDGYSKFVTVGIDGAGNPIGYNYPNIEIIKFDFDFGGEIKIADNFEEYLDKAIRGSLNIHF